MRCWTCSTDLLFNREKVMADLDAIRQAIEERDAAIAQAADLAQRMIYRGNSVGWWHSKATNYGNALLEAWAALKAAGIPCDGQTTVAEGIRKLAAKVGAPVAASDQSGTAHAD